MFFRMPKDIEFAEQHALTLHNLTIDETYPGPLLHDITVFLDVIQSETVALSATHRLPLAILRTLNDRMKLSIEIDLKRPQQKSYPPILGLYLLLRASGLTHIVTTGKKPILQTNEAAYAQWSEMNPTERYGYLLETWFLNADVEIIGEHSGLGGIVETFATVADFFFERIPENGLTIGDSKNDDYELSFSPGKYNLGLMAAFGFIEIDSSPPLVGGGWHIERIRRTPIGYAMLSALFNGFFNNAENLLAIMDADRVPPGILRERLQPFMTEWKKLMVLAEPESRVGVHTFKVSLGLIWRRIEIDSDDTLHSLASAILNAVNFDHDHLYEFTYRDQFGVKKSVGHPYMEDIPVADKVHIGEVPLKIGGEMTFLFDFGDNWEFKVVLEAVDPARTVNSPHVIETHGKPPKQYPEW